MRRRARGGNRQRFRPAPGDRADITVGQPIGAQHRLAGGIDRVRRIGDGETQDTRGIDQTIRMRAQAEDLSAIGALSLEHGAGIVETMRQNMHPGIAPGDECPVEPYPTVAVVERNKRHDRLPCNFVTVDSLIL